MPFYIPEPSLAPEEPQIWEETCPGCKHTYTITAATHWNNCTRCDGQFCQRCVTTEGQCFACAMETHPCECPCENCRKVTQESTMGALDQGEDEAPLWVCQPCWRALENQRIARHHQELKQRGERAGHQELASIIHMFGASFLEDLDREAGRDYSTLHAERWGKAVSRG